MTLYNTQKDKGFSKVRAEIPIVVPNPIWQKFPGFSFLFDNPGSIDSKKGISELSCNVRENPELELYKHFSEAVEKMKPYLIQSRFHFFSLPYSTYHVTIWDGINHGNINNMPLSTITTKFKDFFYDPISSSEKIWPPLSDEIEYNNFFKKIKPIRFKFESLRSRGDTVLVANLKAADQDSENILADLKKQRSTLDNIFEEYGKPKNSELTPHVAIGYFADENLANKAIAQNNDEWINIFNSEASGYEIEFSSISLYAFTNMVTYFKVT